MSAKWLFILFSAGVILLSAAGAAQANVQPGQLNFDGELRSYWVYIPAGLNAVKPVPVLMLLHGSAGNGEDMRRVTQYGFEKIADRENLVVVYPNAQERRWNEHGGSVDDVGFLLAVIDRLAEALPVDRSRVYIAGISSGGMMAQRMACEKADRIAAVATVAGTMPVELKAACKPARPLPVLMIHGTEDPVVPWAGGAVAGFEEYGTVLSARETAAFWASINQCRGTAAVVPEPDRDLRDGTRVQTESFDACVAGAGITLVTVQGGGHTWPGGFQYLPERFIGKTSREMDANKVIWDFFKNRKD